MRNLRAGDHAFVRELNLSVILHATRDNAPVSRAQLAAITGLNKTTVSSLVKELLDAQFLEEIGILRIEDIGRPSVLLQINPHAGYIIGGEVGVDFIRVVLSNFEAQIVWRLQEQTSNLSGQATILARTIQLIRHSVNHAQQADKRIFGLGIGIPGLVDDLTGTLLLAPNLGWRNVPLKEILESEFEFPIYVNNEANLATLGESFFGVARGAKSVLYVSAGVGLGGGISLEGKLLPGANGFAGEIGHMRLVPNGPRCNCGSKGCWETLVSQQAVIQRVEEAILLGHKSLLAGLGDELTIPMILQAARDGDTVAITAFEETGRFMGFGLANLINVLNPERIVLGGILSLAYEFLMPTILGVIDEISLPWSRKGVKILVAAYGVEACVMGGVATVYDRILSEPKLLSSRLAHSLSLPDNASSSALALTLAS